MRREGMPLDESRSESGSLLILAAALILGACAYSLRLMSFLHAKEAMLAAGVAAFCCARAWAGGVSARGFLALLPLWLWLFVTLVAGLGARVPEFLATEWARHAVILLAASLAYDLARREEGHRLMTQAIVASAAAVALLGWVQYAKLAPGLFPKFEGYPQRVYSVFGNQNLFGGYLALGVVIAAQSIIHAPGAPWGHALALAIIAPALALSGARGAWLAALVGLAVAAVAGRRGGPGTSAPGLSSQRRLLFALPAIGLTALVVALEPAATIERAASLIAGGEPSAGLRLWFWAGAWRMFLDHPWTGVGLGNFMYWSPRYQGEVLHTPGGERFTHNEIHTFHAHCDPLEYLAETGVIGAAFLIWMLLRTVRRRGPEWAGLAALGVFSLTSFPLRSGPHVLCAALLLSMLFARRDESRRADERGRRIGWFAAAFSVGLALFTIMTVLPPSYLQRAAEDVHLAGRDPLPLYRRTLAYPWPNEPARVRYAIALAESGDTDAAIAELNTALRAVDTGETHLLLGALYARQGDCARAGAALRAALDRWPSDSRAYRWLLQCEKDQGQQDALRAEAEKWLEPAQVQELWGPS